ncbi:aminoglycoside phosphotransferase family protein [Chengkuizengella axinellae]|uniref:Phosphotransferase n=1 Tax=Chengkuizengella axinellae TaxID=3064388 RepID=A0ABT9J380_9BACL|nr:phosphotransferase [Chengkuizengella sp. 2205SS18-9]MDP5275444.1 phosphotransferase [Chengkuizengella sp. 2205SS18-9]
MITKLAPKMEIVKKLAEEQLNESVELTIVTSGISTYVYRIRVKNKVYYLRILPEQNVSFAAEVKVHQTLRSKGILVPKIVHFEQKNKLIGLSIMIVEEIVGSSLIDSSYPDQLNQVLFEAGKQLALINQVKVEGFGWIDRQRWLNLVGEKKTFEEFYNSHLENDLFNISDYNFDVDEKHAIKNFLITGLTTMKRVGAHLTHGDFDFAHIYQDKGKYTGIIDFGEIMGGSPLYDLGHFKIHDGDDPTKFKNLKEGYKEIVNLSYEEELEIELWALFVGIRRLSIIHDRPWNSYHEHLIRSVKNRLTSLKRMM